MQSGEYRIAPDASESGFRSLREHPKWFSLSLIGKGMEVAALLRNGAGAPAVLCDRAAAARSSFGNVSNDQRRREHSQ